MGLGKRPSEEVGLVDRPLAFGGPDAHVPYVGPGLQQEREVVSKAMAEGAREGLSQALDHYGMLKVMRERVREVAAEKIRLMGTAGRSRR